MTRAKEHLPVSTSPRNRVTWTASTQHSVRAMWKHYHHFKAMAGGSAARAPGLGDLFKVWRHLSVFLRSQKALRRQCRLQKRQIVADKVAMAERAMQAGNIRETYSIVRSLAPKDARRRPRLKGTTQEVLTRPQEADLMRQHWSKVYKGKPGRPVPTFTFHFNTEEVVQAIENTKQHKALPQHLAPAGCWKYAAVPIAGLLSRTLLASWHMQQVCIPDCWRHAWLVFISKPHKAGHSPSEYRPIALSSPIGKALLGIVQNRHVLLPTVGIPAISRCQPGPGAHVLTLPKSCGGHACAAAFPL